MVAIYLYLLDDLNLRNSVLRNNQVHCWHQLVFHAMLCFISFCLMTANRMLPLKLQTVNISLNFYKTDNLKKILVQYWKIQTVVMRNIDVLGYPTQYSI